MTSFLSRWWWGGDPDEPNPNSNLTLRDVYVIQQTWKPLYANATDYGMEFFKRLFRKNSETKNYFKMLKDLDEDELSESKQFRAHVISFMSSFNMAILNLQEPEVIIALMNKLGESHKKLHLKEKHFEELKEVILEFLIDHLKLSESTVGSWIRFIDFMYCHIFEEMCAN